MVMSLFSVVAVLEENMSFLKNTAMLTCLGFLSSATPLATPPNCGYNKVNKYQAGLRELTAHLHHLFKISFRLLDDSKNFGKATRHLALQWLWDLSRIHANFRKFSCLHSLDLLWNSLCSSRAHLSVRRSSC